jgi:hypothetical protein
MRLPIQPAKGYSLTCKRPTTSPLPYLSVTRRNTQGELLRFTSTLELAGFDPVIYPQRLENIRRLVNEYLSGMNSREKLPGIVIGQQPRMITHHWVQ